MVTASNRATVEIRPVKTSAEVDQFLDLPYQVYANDPNWVPPIRSSVAKQFAPENPFREYGKLERFLAWRGQQPVGRIVAAVNHRLIEREGQQVGLFGYFECVDDFEVAQALLATAYDWLRQQGMTLARGPINLFTHNGCLFLVDGFDTPPMVLMPYNPPYYPQFIERDGWQKAQDAYSYSFPGDTILSEKFEKAYRIATTSGVTFRPIQTKGEGFEQDARSIYRLNCQMFANNYSATPPSEAEFLEEAHSMQSVLDPDIFPVAEYEGKMVGYWMGLPDLNIPLKQVNGNLDLWGTLKFLWYQRQIDQVRVVLFCVLPEYRRKMVPLALIYLGMQGGRKKGKPYERAELGHVFESNSASRRLIEASGGRIYKTYRIYEKSLEPASAL
jgi:GNAT superfamily N-acetyltransferase